MSISELTSSTWVDLLRWRAIQQPQQRLYTFLLDGETEEAVLTPAELDRQARAVAALLQSHIAAGERALLLYPPGLDYIVAFFACLYAGIVAVPAYPPRPNRSLTRLQAIVTDARATVALTNSFILTKAQGRLNHAPDLAALHWLATDNIPADQGKEWQNPGLEGDSLAFLQYTSGSTAAPKGVMVSHNNLLHNAALLQYSFGTTPESRIVIWLPPYHDMGLIGGILQALYVGCPVTLMAPLDFLQKPVRWLQAISRYRGTLSLAPNFAFDLCVRKTTPEQRATLDLSCWQVAVNGAEPIRLQTLDRFTKAFAPSGFRRQAFYPAYGLAEATLIVSGGEHTAPPIAQSLRADALEQNQVIPVPAENKDARNLISCGRTMPGQEIIIVDLERGTQCPPDRVGEVWVAGPSLAQGYWGRAEETEETFRAYLADTGAGPFLRTGDLGFMRDGELFVAGRLKDLIIIRGRNHYPQDIELVASESHPAFRPGGVAAFSVEAGGEERLVIVQEIARTARRNLDVEAVVGVIRQVVAQEYEVEVYAVLFIKPGSIPKTSSGKIQRYATRQKFLAGTLNVIGEWVQTLDDPGPDVAKDQVEAVAAPTPSTAQAPGAEVIQNWLVTQLAKRLKIAPKDLDLQAPFVRYGLDSKGVVGLSGELEAWLGRRLSPTLLFEYPSIITLAHHLAQPPDRTVPVGETEGERAAVTEPIAIIGIGCRFPGAKGPDAFWQLLQDGVDAISEVPEERWDLRLLYHPDPAMPGKMNTRWGGFLEGVDLFDPQFFGISPREAAHMDPQQRLLLEVAWEALEDAGQVPAHLAGTRTGVFIGISGSDYGQLQLYDSSLSHAYAGTGSALSIAANRLSYFLDLRGPSLAVDTACSSSLVAVHLACQSLQSGESTLALAGGVNLILSAVLTVNFTKAGFMAPDGRCKTFDAGANGYVRGEGAGVVVLKPVSRALADGDPIYALIRGSAINQDGRTNGLTAPGPQSQEAVLREAYQGAAVSPGAVQYVEAHGTGTALGDPIEARALGAVLAPDRPAGRPCAIGSVKTNIGHLEAAAGIAGLIKVALSLKHGAIPPSLHFQEPNPYIPFDELPLYVQNTLTPWPETSHPAIAGVSAFGFGGTNAHTVLESPPSLPPAAQTDKEPATERAQLLPLSARRPAELQALAQSYRDFLAGESFESNSSLAAVCYTASVRRSHFDYRLALVGHSPDEFVAGLEAFLRGEGRSGLSSGHKVPALRARLVFVFPGQGAQWLGMGRGLFEHEPVFRTKIEACERAMRPHITWSLLEQFTGEEAGARLDEIDVVQPTLFAIQVALASLWRAWGVEPDAVVGHSLGEVAAANIAGALSLDDAAQIICRRSQLLRRTSGQGAMAAVDLSLEQAREVLAGAGCEDRVSIAASNSPGSTVLSGDPAALQEILDQLQRQDIFCREVKVNVASHSPQMDPLRPDLLLALQGLRPRPASLPIYSTVTGEISDGRTFDPSYWARNLREPVLFSRAIERLVKDDHTVFVEISPHPILLSSVREGLHHLGRAGSAVPSLKRAAGERATMLESLGAIFTAGYSVSWNNFYSAGGECVRLPGYPWQRQRFWLETQDEGAGSHWGQSWSNRSRRRQNPLLGRSVALAHLPQDRLWETRLDGRRFPHFNDYRLQGTVVVPGTSFLEMVRAAAEEVFGAGFHVISEIAFQEPPFLPAGGSRLVQLILTPDVGEAISFRIYGRLAGADHSLQAWTPHMTGKILPHQGAEPLEVREETFLEDLHARLAKDISAADYYAALAEIGGRYGPAFRGITQLWFNDREALGQVQIPQILEAESDLYHIHPALLETCLQVLESIVIGSASEIGSSSALVPTCVDQVRVYGRPVGKIWSHARLCSAAADSDHLICGDICLFDEAGVVVAEVKGLQLQPLVRKVQPSLADMPAEETAESAPAPDRGEAGRLTLDRLLAAEPAVRRQLLETYLCQQVAGVLMLPPAELNTQQPINMLGLDSLMATELKIDLETDLQVIVTVGTFLKGPTIEQLAAELGEQIMTAAAAAQAESPLELAAAGNEEQPLIDVDQLSDEQVDSLLSELLAEEGGSE